MLAIFALVQGLALLLYLGRVTSQSGVDLPRHLIQPFVILSAGLGLNWALSRQEATTRAVYASFLAVPSVTFVIAALSIGRGSTIIAPLILIGLVSAACMGSQEFSWILGRTLARGHHEVRGLARVLDRSALHRLWFRGIAAGMGVVFTLGFWIFVQLRLEAEPFGNAGAALLPPVLRAELQWSDFVLPPVETFFLTAMFAAAVSFFQLADQRWLLEVNAPESGE